MERFFSNYRINKNVDRKAVNILMQNIKKRTTSSSILVFTAIKDSQEQIQENWVIQKKKNGNFNFMCLEKKPDTLRTTILNHLSNSESVIVVIVCDMKQKLSKKKHIREMWGYKIFNNGKETSLEEVSSEDIYKFSTTSIETGKSIPPIEEIVYCGPDGKICGWDIN